MRRAGLLLLFLAVVGTLSAVQIVRAADFFPIGIFESGIAPTYPNAREKWNQACGLNESPLDTSQYAKQWSCLDEVRGDTAADSTYGYTTGFNVVQSYAHGDNAGHPNWLWEVHRKLDAADVLDFKVMIGLPSVRHPNPYLPCWNHLLQSGDTSAGDSLILAVGLHPAVYGWYLADEPMNLDNDEGFHKGAVSAENLRAAYQHFHSSYAQLPYLFSMPYYPGAFSNVWDHDAIWRWDNTEGGTREFFDPGADDSVHSPIQDYYCHGTRKSIVTSQNFTNAADIIQVDTYLGPANEVSVNQGRWDVILRQHDVVDSTSAGGFQAVLACSPTYVNGDTSTDGAVFYESEWKPCRTENHPSLVRFSRADLRYQMYTALIHNARGIWFYSYKTTFDECTSKWRACARSDSISPYFASVVAPLSVELASLQSFLVDAATVVGRRKWVDALEGYVPTVTGDNGDLQLSILARDNDVLVIAANVSADSLPQCSIHFAGGTGVPPELRPLQVASSARVLFENTIQEHNPPREIVPVQDGVLVDAFAPREVHVYKFRSRAAPG